MNRLQLIGELGQALWLDDIHRSLMTSVEITQQLESEGIEKFSSSLVKLLETLSSEVALRNR